MWMAHPPVFICKFWCLSEWVMLLRMQWSLRVLVFQRNHIRVFKEFVMSNRVNRVERGMSYSPFCTILPSSWLYIMERNAVSLKKGLLNLRQCSQNTYQTSFFAFQHRHWKTQALNNPAHHTANKRGGKCCLDIYGQYDCVQIHKNQKKWLTWELLNPSPSRWLLIQEEVNKLLNLRNMFLCLYTYEARQSLSFKM